MNESAEPLISVCIANYNGADCIEECIASVLAQQDAPALEVLVHDDASSDESLQIISRFPQVRLLRSAENVGFCISNNRMVAAAHGTLILLLNNDAVLLAGALREVADLMTRDHRVGIATLRQYAYDTDELLDCGMCFDPFLNPIPVLEQHNCVLGMVMGSCLAVRRPIWDASGGFPEFFGSIAEDMYVCLYARILGYDVACAATSGYRHRVGNTFGGGKVVGNRLHSRFTRRALSERNKTFNMYLFYPQPALLLLLPLHLLSLLLEGLALSLLRADREPLTRIYIPAIAALLQHRRQLRCLRRRIQSDAETGLRAFFAPFGCVPWKLRLLLRHGIPRID